MRQNAKRSLAVFLAILQALLLLPLSALAAPEAAPVRNETIVGTVQFGTFSFAPGGTAPDGKTAWEGGDYTKPFVYTDDYFAAPSYESAPASKVQTWRELPDIALVSATADLALAAFGSNEETDNYPRYSKCAEAYLRDCGFDHIAVNEDFEHENAFNALPTKDSVGVAIGMKEITVWDAAQNRNRTCTLIAVGVRGGGYGAEWASNVTLGESGRHKGFADSEEKILSTLRDYLHANGVDASSDVKYWIGGFSRGGAIANLAAGDISSAPETYFAEKRDVYCYTFECPAAAVISEDPDGTVFPNIHNVLNRMDPVPRVSLPEFGNGRLGVDYTIPDHATTDRIDEYYARMYAILKVLAPGYGADPDPVIAGADPAVYPYNTKIPIYDFSLSALISNPSDLGLEVYHDWQGTPIGDKAEDGYALYVDEYLDKFVAAFGASKAWDYNPRFPNVEIRNTDPMTHRAKFAANGYQEAIRTIVGTALAAPGAALKDMFGNISGALPSILLPAARMVINLVANYDLYPREGAAADIAVDVETVLFNVLRSSGMFEGKEDALREAAKTLAPPVTRLFLYDRINYGSQYLGTLMKYAGSMLTTHNSELVAAWNLSLDDNYTGSYRELTVPVNTEITLYEFRPGLDDALSMDGRGAMIAQVKRGEFVSRLDERVSVSTQGDTQTVRYPAFLDVRAEVRMADGGSTADLAFQMQELRPDETGMSMITELERDAESGNIVSRTMKQTLEACDTAEAARVNALSDSTAYPLSGDSALLITTGRSTNALDGAVTGKYDVAVRSGDETADMLVVKEYSAEPKLNGSNTSFAAAADLSKASAREKTVSADGRSQISVPGSSIYFDDDFADKTMQGTPGDSVYSVQNQTTVDGREADGRTTAKKLCFRFAGSRIDLYCTGRQDGGYLLASVRDESGARVTQEGKAAIQIGKCRSDATRYNSPTISFDGLKPDQTYVLELTAVQGANYTLDAVRVYNPGGDSARFFSVRSLLQSGKAATFRTGSARSAEDSSGTAVRLGPGESLAFRAPAGYAVALGLSAPENQGAGKLTVTGGEAASLDVATVTDTYYPVAADKDGVVIVYNSGAVPVSVSNVRLTPEGSAAPADAGALRAEDLTAAVRAFLSKPVTKNDAPAAGEPLEALMRGLLSQYAKALLRNVQILLNKT